MYTYEAFLIVIVIAYLLGSIPFGVVLAKYSKLPDPRTIGSGNIGATNMLRTGNKRAAMATLLLDMGKGAVAVLLGHIIAIVFVLSPDAVHEASKSCDAETIDACLDSAFMLGTILPPALALLFAALGHMYSPWLKFEGGKGVATILGGLFVLYPPAGLLFCGVFLLLFYSLRYVSLASIAALIAVPLLLLLVYGFLPTLPVAAASATAIYKHRENIARLRAGTEPKMQGKRDAA